MFAHRCYTLSSRPLVGRLKGSTANIAGRPRYFNDLPHLHAEALSSSQDVQHVKEVADHLTERGILKVSLRFEDDDSSYLQQLIMQLHGNHFHGLPITHSASRGWFWDVRPQPALAQAISSNQARSETMNNFPWHTDCSYEVSPPRYFALQVLQPDKCGGGTLSILDSSRLLALLSPATRAALSRPEFNISVPPEFIKDENQKNIIGSVLRADSDLARAQLRFRSDIISALTPGAEAALDEFREVLSSTEVEAAKVHLTPDALPRGSIILVDNRQWLHGRNQVKDLNRHLRRVRWDSRPF